MEKTSSSKCNGFSLASARGLFWGKQRQRVWIYRLGRSGSVLGWLTLGKIYFKWLRMWRMENPKGFGFYL
jgi:hypothetical protein